MWAMIDKTFTYVTVMMIRIIIIILHNDDNDCNNDGNSYDNNSNDKNSNKKHDYSDDNNDHKNNNNDDDDDNDYAYLQTFNFFLPAYVIAAIISAATGGSHREGIIITTKYCDYGTPRLIPSHSAQSDLKIK